MKKWLSIALALSMLLSMTACSSDGAGNTTAAETTQAQTGEEEMTAGVNVADLPEYNAADYVSIDGYTGIEVEELDKKVTEDEFETALNQLLASYATVEQITDRNTAEGDTINFDYSGAVDGEVFQGGTAANQTTTLGQGGWIDGFEEGLIDRPCGEEYVIDATFPEEYPNNPDLSGKTAQFTITIHYIEGDEIIPELTDDFVKGLEDYTCGTVDEFKLVYMDELTKQKTAYMENQEKDELWSTLLEKATFNGYPDGYMDAYIQDMTSYYTNIAAAYGYELEDFIQGMYGMDMESFNSAVSAQAEYQLQSEMLYKYIAEQEGFEVSEEEYMAMVQEYMDYYGYDDMTTFVNAYGVDNVERQGYADALFNKVINFCMENAQYVAPADTEAETTAEETKAE